MEQKRVGDNATLTVAQFGSEYEMIMENVPIKEVQKITEEQYRISGCTALLDSTGKIIIDTGAYLRSIPEENRPDKVILVVMTDGLENESREFNYEKIKEMIKHQEEKYSWQFVFLGADIDTQQAEMMGFAAASSVSYSKTSSLDSYIVASNSVSDVRRGFASNIGETKLREKMEEVNKESNK